MIKILCGGKKHAPWAETVISEYNKRLRGPFAATWEFHDDEKFAKLLKSWPFTGQEFVILLDERGQMLSSPELATKLENCFTSSLHVVVLIGGAYGVSADTRARASLTLSLSKMVFPHMLSRVILAEQLYRAQEIRRGSKYHHP